MAPPAPGLLSITNVPLVISWTLGCTTRAIMSVEPPGGKGTIMVTGFEGQACASAPVAASAQARVARIRFMRFLLGVSWFSICRGYRSPLGPGTARRGDTAGFFQIMGIGGGMGAERGPGEGTASLEKAIDVLEAVADSGEGIGHLEL